jgi:hypothetical protein
MSGGATIAQTSGHRTRSRGAPQNHFDRDTSFLLMILKAKRKGGKTKTEISEKKTFSPYLDTVKVENKVEEQEREESP